MFRQELHDKIFYYSLFCLASALPFSDLYAAIPVGILAVNWVIEGNLRGKANALLHNKIACFFSALYLLYLAGLAYTSDINYGLFDIEVKLSLVIFPIVLSTTSSLHKVSRKKIFLAFTIGNIAVLTLCLARAVLSFSRNHLPSAFLYDDLSFMMHPGYFSMYINLSLFFLLMHLSRLSRMKEKIAAVLAITFFSCSVILISSKMGIITLTAILACAFLYIVFKEKKIKSGLIMLLFSILISLLLYRSFPLLTERFNWAKTAVTEKTIDKTETESTAVRILIWKAAVSSAKEHPFYGAGTGDVRNSLEKKYSELGLTGALKKKLNAHNQFLQTTLALGIPGGLLLLATILIPMAAAARSHDYVYLFFLILILFNFSVESMLETQAGVLFYAFFNSLLMFKKEKSL